MTLRVLEMFAGMGGMHRACDLANTHLGIDTTVVAAVDINTTANEVYKHNHHNKHLQRNIVGFSARELQEMKPQIILMSPPCQPHTRQGHRRDKEDARSQPLVHIMSLLPDISSLRYLLLENVQGFETSESRQMVVDTLCSAGFKCQEFLLNPLDLGIPNSRLRYYLLAKRKEEDWCFQTQDSLIENFLPLSQHLSIFGLGLGDVNKKKISDYLEPLDSDELDKFLVTDKDLSKRAGVLDIVTKNSNRSCCFTKSYSQYLEGTGSVLKQAGDVDDVYKRAEIERENPEQYLNILKELKLRFFTPREVSRLMGFPSELEFPDNITIKQRYKVLGNSLNVTVVGLLIYVLLK